MHIIAVCPAGRYRNGTSCEMCQGNTVKRLAGNETHCNDDPPCNGITAIVSEDHTECRECN